MIDIRPSPGIQLAVARKPYLATIFEMMANDIIDELEKREDIIKQLQAPAPPGYYSMRLSELKDESGVVIFRAWIYWDHKDQLWGVCLEHAKENYFGDQPVSEGNN